jgi:endo-1,4-beta-xylanase
MKTRSLITALAASILCLGTSSNDQGKSLREAAQARGLLVGTAVRPAHFSEADYASTLAHEYNMLEPEDVLKWETVHPQRQTFDFSQGDQIVEFALQHDMKVRGHTLVWHRQNPRWLTEGKYSSAELAEILKNHIQTVVGHYRGKIFAWDVVNEAFDEARPGELRSTIWRDQPGISLAGDGTLYIERSFRWAHGADPGALLFYNEAGAENVNPKSDAIYAMVRDFRQRGVPIDGVGLQMHVSNLHIDPASISENIKRFTALGVQVQITEMDVAVPIDRTGNARPEDLQEQAEIYRQIVTACRSYRGCTAIQTWGFTDKYSWIGSHSKQTQGEALPFDREYRAKPAYRAMRDAVETRGR